MTKRSVSLLAVALSIVGSMAMLLMAALVSARERAIATAPVADDEVTASEPTLLRPIEAAIEKEPERSQEKPTTGRRLPICPGYLAKIVSQNSNPALSLASLSYNGKGATLVRPGTLIGKHQVIAIGYDGGRMSPSVVLASRQEACQAMTFERAEPIAEKRTARAGHRLLGHSDHTEVLVDRSALETILERIFELTRGVQVAPYLENGSIAGFRLLGIAPGSLLSALGLENGDAITRVNGKAITTMEAALSFYTNIRSFERFDIELSRAGRPTRLQIRIT